MSVANALELFPHRIDALLAARWQSWQSSQPSLPPIADRVALREWMHTSDSVETDGVLRFLVTQADPAGADDRDAATVVAWLMLPAASLLAHQFRFVDREIDLHVAALLWIEIRTYPWRNAGRIAPNLRWRLHRAIVSEWHRPDLPLTDASLTDDPQVQVPLWADLFSEEPASDEEAAELIDDAWQTGVIDDYQRDLLGSVLAVSGALTSETGRSAALIGVKVSDIVGPQLSVSPRTVRRHLTRCIQTLSLKASA